LRLLTLLLAFAALASPRPARAQQNDLGHKTLGTLGLLAGAQPPRGVYVSDRFVYYAANKLVDRNGDQLPVGLDIDAYADALGLGVTLGLKPLAANWTGAIGAPVIRSSARTEQPQASIDRSGLGDLYVTPLQLGWRLPLVDLVTGYGFYAPTASFEPGGGSGGVGRGFWTHQFSLGGTVYSDRTRIGSFSALASYDLNEKKRDIDITRGDTIQIQGGIGARLSFVMVGLTGYALWQVRDDRGSDLPPILKGARDRAFGLGPELTLMIPPIRSQLTLRYEHDVAVRSRPLGQIFFVSLGFAAWRPSPPAPPAP
jgi:hypothetical protein